MATISTNNVVIARWAGAMYNVALDYKTDQEVLAAVAGGGTENFFNTIYARDFGNQSNSAVAAMVTKNLGLTGNLATIAVNFITGQLNATVVARGAVIAGILNAYAQMTTDPSFGPSVIAWETVVANAVNYSTNAANTQFVSLPDLPPGPNPGAFTLTNGTDVATANFFTSGLVYNPAGTDRINALQSEDTLTGTGTNPTLNATLGNHNDNGAASITPTLKNIETVSLAITGNTNTLDVRFADSLKTLSINKLTAEAGNAVAINNIGQPAANLTVKDSALVGNTVAFNYIDGVLAGTTAAGTGETGNLTVSNVNMNVLHVGNVPNTQGFETLNLNVANTNQISSLEAIDLESLKVTGSGALSIVNTLQQTDRVLLLGDSINIGDGLGIRTIDLSGFTGTSDAIDISSALGGHADPANSGVKYFSTTTGSAGADTFWTNVSLAADSAVLKDKVDGGAGADTLKIVDANVKRASEVPGKTDTTKAIASVTNVENLNLQLQSVAAQTVNLAAFDAALVAVALRNEQKTGSVASVDGAFTLREVGATLGNGGISLLHASGAGATGQGTPTGAVDTVNIRLADASGTKDSVALTVKTDLNTSSTYNYAIGLEAERNAANAYTGFVENLTLNDNDNETNTVTSISGNDSKGNMTALGLTGTVTLTGGSAGKGYTVKTALSATTVDAATQLSNLTLRVGQPLDKDNYGTTVLAQTVKLGAGNDLLTFDGPNFLNAIDTVTGGDGTDTVRAWYSKDGGAPTLTAVEKFQLMATAATTIDLAKSTGITELALLSDQAVETEQHGVVGKPTIFTTAPAPLGTMTTSVVTLQNSNLSSVNFFGDTISNAAGESTRTVQNFNGLTLANNAKQDLTVNINASLDPGSAANPNKGVSAYNLGQLTAHGTTAITINVANEKVDTTTTAKDATTTIANIFAKDATSLKLVAPEGNVDVGTVTGNALNNSLTTFDASGVGGNVKATVIALGDNAVVKLSAAGNDIFSASGSSGKLINIDGGNGNNTITGSGQSDIITTGSGNDEIAGGRGDNVIKSGAGNDFVTGSDGNNTFDIGSGTYERVRVNIGTANDATKATNVIAGTGTVAETVIDLNGDGAAELNSMFAVGRDSDLTLSFTGVTLNASSSTLNGRLVDTGATLVTNGVNVAGGFTVTGGNTYTVTDANSHFVYASGGAGAGFTTFVGGVASDAVFGLQNIAYNFQTGAGNDSIVIGSAVATAGSITAGTGTDKIAMTAGNAAAITINFNAGDSSAADGGVDADSLVYGATPAGVPNQGLGNDIIHLNSAAITLGANTKPAGVGTAQISAQGVATFDVADTTLAQHISAVASALGAGAAGGSVVWAEPDTNGGQAHSYLYITDGFAGASSTDLLVELVGVPVTGGITVSGGNITAIGGAPAPITPTFSVAGPAAVTEGSNATYIVTLSAAQATSTNVTYTLAGTGGAVLGTDTGTPTPATPLVFAAGETTKTVVVPITADALPETGEGISVTLSAPSAGTALGTSVANTAINDPGAFNIVDLGNTPVTATAAAEAFVYDFQVIGGRAVKAGDGEVTITGFDVTQDKLVFHNVSGAPLMTEAQFMAFPGVVIAENPFALPAPGNTSIYFDPLAAVLGGVTLVGVLDANLTNIVAETSV